MKNVIFAKDLHVSDVFRLPDGWLATVYDINHRSTDVIIAYHEDPVLRDVQMSAGRYSAMILLHRPYPEGKTKARMQCDILELARKLLFASELERDGVATQLREAIEQYELGLPLAGEEKK